MKTDAQIQQDVLRELKWDWRVKETDIGVSVQQGVVALTGTILSYTERVAAQEAAHRVVGVLDVANDIEVKPLGELARTDAEIAHAVRQALELDLRVPHERIHTTVADGWVTLEGGVDEWHQRADAERAVRHLAGVRGVSNKTQVRAPRLDAADIQSEIEKVLEQRAHRTAKRLRVEVSDGTATVSGTVHNWDEKQAVVGAARFTPGVREMHDRVRIDPYE